MTIVDTSVWIDYFGDVDNLHTDWLDRQLMHEPLGLTDLILCELLQGARNEKLFNEVQQKMAEFDIYDSGGREMAVASASNYRFLRARGLTVRKTIDCIIATHCIRNGHSLLHRDRDFDAFEQHLGLQVIYPSTH